VEWLSGQQFKNHNMHTSDYKTVKIHHNGGYDGHCILLARNNESAFDIGMLDLEKINKEGLNLNDEKDLVEITVDFEDLKAFVFDYLRSKRQEKIDSMNDDEFEKLLINDTL
jgi:hypothetical protein